MCLHVTEQTLAVMERAGGVLKCRVADVFCTAVRMFLLVPRNPSAYNHGRGCALLIDNLCIPSRLIEDVEQLALRYEVGLETTLAAAVGDYAMAKVGAQTQEEFLEQYSR